MKLTVPRLKRMIYTTQELKHKEFDIPGFAVGINWALDSVLETIQQGTASNERIGDRIYVKSIQVSFYMQCIPATFDKAGAICKVLLYHNKQAAGNLIQATTMFTGDDFWAHRNLTRMPAVSIPSLRSSSMFVTSIDAAGNAFSPPSVITLRIAPRKVIEYTGTTGTVADLLRDDYGYGVVCNTPTSMAVTIRGTITYYDA